MKRYITYTRKKINDNYYQDPNTNNKVEIETNWHTTFYETPYEYNWVFLAYVEYGDEFTNEQIEYFRNLDTDFNFTFITEEEANIFLQNFWKDEEWNYYVSVANFEFTNNTPTYDF